MRKKIIVTLIAAVVSSVLSTGGSYAAEPSESSSEKSIERIDEAEMKENGDDEIQEDFATPKDELSTYSDSNIPHQNQHVVVHSADEYFTIFARTYNAN